MNAITRPSRQLRQALFVGANLLLAAIVYFALIAPLRQFLNDRAEAVTQRRATLARYEAIVARESAVQDYARLVTESNARGELLDGASEGIINANLQARLKTLAETAGVTVRSIQILPVKTLRGVTLVGARIDVSGSIEPVHSLVRALEGESPLLLVLTASLRGQSMAWGFLQAETQNTIEAQFDVYGGAPSRERS
jgi:hypothetical protein